MVQWLRFQSSTGGESSIPGQGNKSPRASWHSQNQNHRLDDKFSLFPLEKGAWSTCLAPAQMLCMPSASPKLGILMLLQEVFG